MRKILPMLFLFGLLLVSVSFSATLVVNGTGAACQAGDSYYDNISAAFLVAADGDDVIVCQNGSSSYRENVIVNVSVNLIGNESDVRVEADNRSLPVIEVRTTDWVNITDLHVYGANGTTAPFPPEEYFTCGIFVNNSEYTWIENVTAGNNNASGIMLYRSNFTRIINNTAYGTRWPGDSAAGFLALESHYNTFENNTARDNEVHGFNMDDNCTHTNFTNNYATGGLTGISTYESSHNRYVGNVLETIDRIGLAVKRHSNNNTVLNNTAFDIDGDGFAFENSTNTTFIGNTAYNCSDKGFIAVDGDFLFFNNNTFYDLDQGPNIGNITFGEFKNNLIYDIHGMAALGLFSNFQPLVIENLTVHSSNNGVVIGFLSGVGPGWMVSAENVTINNSEIYNNTNIGISIYNGSEVNITNTQIYDNGVGVYLTTTSTNNILLDNLEINRSLQSGIILGNLPGFDNWGPENVTINNSIVNNCTDCISINYANYTNVLNTDVMNYSWDGVYMDHTNSTNLVGLSIINPNTSFGQFVRNFAIRMNRSYEVLIEDNVIDYTYMAMNFFGRWNENITIRNNNLSFTGGLFSSCGLSGSFPCPGVPIAGKEPMMNTNITNNKFINSSGVQLDHYISDVDENINISDNLFAGMPGVKDIYQYWCHYFHNTGNIILSNNNITDYYYGVFTESIDNSTNITYNNITNCTVGIFLHPDADDIIYFSNNAMVDNYYHFGIYEDTDLENYYQNITTSNTVDGKPMYYYIENVTTDGTFDNTQPVPADAGWVGIINSSDILVENFTFMHNLQGVLILESENITMNNVTSLINYWSMTLGTVNSSFSDIAVGDPEIPALPPFGPTFLSYGVLMSADDNNITNFSIYSQPHIYMAVLGSDANGTVDGLKLGFNENYGIIEYDGNLNESWIAVADGDTAFIPVTLSRNAAFGEDFVSINSSSIWTHNLFDGPATVTLRTGGCPVSYYRSAEELPESADEITRNGAMFTPAVSTCTGDTVVFDVPGFTGYAVSFSEPPGDGGKKNMDFAYERLECPEDGVLLNVTAKGSILSNVDFRVLRNGMIYYETEGSYGEMYLFLPKEGSYYIEASKTGYKKESVSFSYGLCKEEPEPEPELGCTDDSECLMTHYCNLTVHECLLVPCDCGIRDNHTCYPYECCEDEDCILKYASGWYCVDHLCVVYELVVPESVFVGDKVIVKALVDGEPIADTVIKITGPEGEIFEAVTDRLGEIVYTPQNSGEHDIGLFIREDTEAATDILNAKMKEIPPPEPEPEPVVEEEFPWCWLLLLLLIILLAAYYYYSKRKGMLREQKKKK